MTFSNIPDELNCEIEGNNVKFEIMNVSTDWISSDDSFLKRIDNDNLNKCFLTEHLIKEIEIKNILDEAIRLLENSRFPQAVEKFDEVLYYDPEHSQALINKSHALRGQKHFVKSLRYYRKAVKADSNLKDIEYHKLLLSEANDERSNFPKIKLNIYAGDEHFAKGEFEKAVESYNRALVNPSKFKDRILSKLMNKKATALVKLKRYDDAYDCFKKSDGDYAFFGRGYCEFELERDVNDKFKTLLDIDKAKQLKQAIILNELGFYNESLEIYDYLMKNHFKVDDYYRRLLAGKIDAMEGLGLDTGEVGKIIDFLFKN